MRERHLSGFQSLVTLEPSALVQGPTCTSGACPAPPSPAPAVCTRWRGENFKCHPVLRSDPQMHRQCSLEAFQKRLASVHVCAEPAPGPLHLLAAPPRPHPAGPWATSPLPSPLMSVRPGPSTGTGPGPFGAGERPSHLCPDTVPTPVPAPAAAPPSLTDLPPCGSQEPWGRRGGR